jgi:hypothetical protein
MTSTFQRRARADDTAGDEGPDMASDFSGFLRSTEEAIYILLWQREPAAAIRVTAGDQRGERRGRPRPRRCSQYVVALGGLGRGAIVGGPCGYRRTAHDRPYVCLGEVLAIMGPSSHDKL